MNYFVHYTNYYIGEVHVTLFLYDIYPLLENSLLYCYFITIQMIFMLLIWPTNRYFSYIIYKIMNFSLLYSYQLIYLILKFYTLV